MIRKFVKTLLSHSIYREGSVRTIFRGPCRGLRYRIFPEYGLSPMHGGWEREAQALMVKHITPSAIAYDVGANFGIHTLLMARLASRGKVYAFEPIPDIFAALQENVKLNGFQNVDCLQLALSDRTATAEFVRGHHGGAGHLSSVGADAAVETLSVKAVAMDDLVYAQGADAPTFLKVDVEGAESRVMAGAERLLREVRPIVLLDLHSPQQDFAVGSLLLNAGYSAYRTTTGVRIENLDKGWPNPEGLWGQFIAFPR